MADLYLPSDSVFERRAWLEAELDRFLSEHECPITLLSPTSAAVLTRLGAPRVVLIRGDVSGSVIVLGDGNRVTVPNGGRLASRWQELQVGNPEAADLCQTRIAGLYASLSSPLCDISFEALLHEAG